MNTNNDLKSCNQYQYRKILKPCNKAKNLHLGQTLNFSNRDLYEDLNIRKKGRYTGQSIVYNDINYPLDNKDKENEFIRFIENNLENYLITNERSKFKFIFLIY